MLYRFKCKATGDLLMLAPQAQQLWHALGREPADRGILEPADMAAALQALRKAVDDDDRARALDAAARSPVHGVDTRDAQMVGRDPVSARQRLWPMVEMIRRAQAAGEPVVWGV